MELLLQMTPNATQLQQFLNKCTMQTEITTRKSW